MVKGFAYSETRCLERWLCRCRNKETYRVFAGFQSRATKIFSIKYSFDKSPPHNFRTVISPSVARCDVTISLLRHMSDTTYFAKFHAAPLPLIAPPSPARMQLCIRAEVKTHTRNYQTHDASQSTDSIHKHPISPPSCVRQIEISLPSTRTSQPGHSTCRCETQPRSEATDTGTGARTGAVIA